MLFGFLNRLPEPANLVYIKVVDSSDIFTLTYRLLYLNKAWKFSVL